MDTGDNLDQGPRRSARIQNNAQGGTSSAAQQSNNQNSRKRRKQQDDASVDDTGSQSRTRAERSQSEAQLPANELSDIRQQRFRQIIDKLESYGLAREFDFMNEEERKQAMAQPWAKQKKLLTDRTWTNVEQAMVQYFREYQYQRSIRERLRLLKSIVHDFELSQPMGAVLPGVIDFAYLPPILAILQLPVGTQVTADHFAAFVPRMHDLATRWKKDMVEVVCRKTIEATAQDIPQIRAFLDAYEEEATNAATASDEIWVPSDKLQRTLNDAWTWLESSGYWYSCNPGRHDIFTCHGACGSPGYVCVVGFPRILTHRCMKKSRHWYNMIFEYLPEGDVFQEICYSELHERPLVNALEEIELNRFITENAGRTLFGTDDTSFRPQEWDDLDYRFTCEPCGRNKKCWHGMTWRRAVSVFSHSAESTCSTTDFGLLG
ncbi:hypothetical protein K474DRAFT_1339826 [Panus rudis PR-1116 ss-1]|nr:hypothetical protein K474DRAFT_1339826 [Panus rudis PR-1116 ss-1]